MAQPIYLFCGHHKCATTWISQIVADICRDAGLRLHTLHNEEMFGSDLAGHIGRNRLEFVSLTNAKWAWVAQLDNFRGFHVIRDPRDIVVSAYFSHLKTHPTENWKELEDVRETLQGLPQWRGIRREIARNSYLFDDLQAWQYNHPNMLEMKMESFVTDPYNAFLRVFAHLGLLDSAENRQLLSDSVGRFVNRVYRWSNYRLPLRRAGDISAETILSAAYKHRYEKKAGGRKQGEESTDSHYRKGVAGDWINHFNADHVTFFKERYPGLLVKLGYETNSAWGVSQPSSTANAGAA